ncbi:MAG: hypothetical protein QF453_04785 [Candidatus Marinimicrobia bacterium]|jgi:predicted dithiol-disulfide oxidoreductase (DUF899 family)|nr:hypothetical protein [Candidatus Neomarinimicrobiota bacterium]
MLTATKYPDSIHKDSFMVGLEYQDFVTDVLFREMGWSLANYSSKKYQYEKGENIQNTEIKFDEGWTKYNHLSIEIAEKSKNDVNMSWVESGILAGSTFYVQGNYDELCVFATNHLVYYYENNNPELTEKFGTIKTFYLEREVIERIAIKTITT